MSISIDKSGIARTSEGLRGAGQFAAILKGEILDATVLTRRGTGTEPVPVADLVADLDATNNRLQDFTEQYTGKAEWAAMKRNPDLNLAHAGLELAHANADFRLTEKFMTLELRRHAAAGEEDSYDQQNHQDNLTIRLFEKQGNRLRKVRAFGGSSGVEKVIAESAAELAEMKASGAEYDPERCFAFHAANLAHAHLRHYDVNHRLRENRAESSKTWTLEDIKDIDLQDRLVLEMTDTMKLIADAQEELFPYNR